MWSCFPPTWWSHRTVTSAWIASLLTICCPTYELTILARQTKQCKVGRHELHCLELTCQISMYSDFFGTCIGNHNAGQACMTRYWAKEKWFPDLTIQHLLQNLNNEWMVWCVYPWRLCKTLNKYVVYAEMIFSVWPLYEEKSSIYGTEFHSINATEAMQTVTANLGFIDKHTTSKKDLSVWIV
jgi:hypothetical protein